jgi:hypothetical protein
VSRQWSARPCSFMWSDPLALSPIYAKARDAGDAVPVRIATRTTAFLVTKHELVRELLRSKNLSARLENLAIRRRVPPAGMRSSDSNHLCALVACIT